MWEAIMEPLTRFVEVLNTNWPKLVATLLLLIGGWVVAKVLKVAIVRGLKLAKLDMIAEKAGIEGFLKKGGMEQTSVELLGTLIFWISLIIILVMVLGIWNIDIGLSSTLVPFLPKVFAALVILILGLFIASLIEDVVRAYAANAEIQYAFFLAKLVKWIIVVFVVLTSIQQLEIETQLISWGFLVILGSLGLGTALAIGLGAKDIVAKKLGAFVEEMDKQQADAGVKPAKGEETPEEPAKKEKPKKKAEPAKKAEPKKKAEPAKKEEPEDEGDSDDEE